MVAVNEDDQPLAQDQINEIRDWLDATEHELQQERISYGELADLQEVYDVVKVIDRGE